MRTLFKVLLLSFFLVVIPKTTAQNNTLSFDGIDDIVSLGDNNILQVSGNTLSISAWIKAESFAANLWQNTVIDNHFTLDGYVLRVGGNGVVDFVIGDGTWHSVTSDDYAIQTNIWYHLVALYDGTTQKIYVNGVLVASVTATFTFLPGTHVTTIGGASLLENRFFDGQIDEVAIWDTALSSSEVTTLFNSGIPVSATSVGSGLLAYYSMNSNSGAGSLLTDDENTGTDYDGTIYGASWVVGGPDALAPTAVFSSATDNVGSVTGALSSGDTTDDTALVLSGTNESASTVQVYNGSTSLGAATISGTTWSYTATISDATTYLFNITETDTAGNISDATSDFTVIGDFTAPTITSVTADWGAYLSTVEDNASKAVTVVTSGAEDGQTVTLSLNSVDYTGTVASNSTSITVSAAALQALVYDSSYTLTVNVSDAAGNTATTHNSTSFTSLNSTGVNNTLDFDGVDDYVSIPDNSTLDFTTAMTVELWMKPDNFSKTWEAIVTKGDNSWRIHRNADEDKVNFAINNTSLTNFSVTSTSTITDGVWYHVVGVYTGSQLEIYINGILENTTSVSTTINNSSYNVCIGENLQATGRQFNGQIDEVRIWSDVRTSSEITASMNTELTGSETNLVAYYQFNETSGSVAAEGVNNYDGTLVNMASEDWVTANWQDITAPTAVFSSATDNVGSVTGALSSGDTTDDTALVLSGTNESSGTVQVYNGSTSLGAASISGTTWTYTATIADATTYLFNVKETDIAGNTSDATSNFTVVGDLTAPTAVFSTATDNVGSVTGALSSGDTTDDTALVLSGTNESASTVQVYNGSTSLGAATISGTTWSYTATIAAATTYLFNVTETDIAGNTSDATSNFTVVGDFTAPTIAVTAAEVSDGDTSSDASLSLTFTISETTTNFVVGDITVTGGTLSSFTGSGTIYTATFTPSTAGATTIDVSSATFTDAIGNANTAASQFNWLYEIPVPSITSFSPTTGAVGSSVTISGTNFNATAANNIVYFGAVKATVTAATSSSLTLTVPNSSSHSPITVTTGGLVAAAMSPFLVTNTLISTVSVNNSSFADISTYSSVAGNSTWHQVDKLVAIADFDGDGKPDVVKTGTGSTVMVHLNTCTEGEIDSDTFDSGTAFATNGSGQSIATADFDGDGKMDLVSLDISTASFLRNTSTVGSISFATKVDLSISNKYRVRCADIDGDGKIDIVVAPNYAYTYSCDVYLNTSSVGSISFSSSATNFVFPISHGRRIELGDINMDGKSDIVAFKGSGVDILLNTTTTTGSPTFSSVISLSGNGMLGAIADFDSDGDNDFISDNGYLHQNNISGAVTSDDFSNTTITNIASYAKVTAGDFNADGKVDILTGYNNSGAKTQFLLNEIVGTTITGTSFTNYEKSNQGNEGDVLVCDIDGDGKPEIISSMLGSSSFGVFRNQMYQPPTISSTTLSADNTSIDVTFSDAVYTTTGSSGLASSFRFYAVHCWWCSYN